MDGGRDTETERRRATRVSHYASDSSFAASSHYTLPAATTRSENAVLRLRVARGRWARTEPTGMPWRKFA
eukprot:2380338-Rhodomonas_salina.1